MTTAMKLIQQGHKEGLKEGHKEGVKEGKSEAAHKMLSKGYPIEEICDVTGLSEKDILEYKNSNFSTKG